MIGRYKYSGVIFVQSRDTRIKNKQVTHGEIPGEERKKKERNETLKDRKTKRVVKTAREKGL